MEEVKIPSTDDYRLNVHVFPVDGAKGCIQLIHGMEEHQERYEPFIAFLNENGYTVVSSNMRGHGEDAPRLGFFKEKKGYEFLLEDQKTITTYIRDRFQVDEVTIFAHSMGTIITRNLMQTESKNYRKVVLSGFPCPNSASGFGIFMANTIQLFRGPFYHSAFLQHTAVGVFNKDIKDAKTDVDWLSVNERNVETYRNDPYCGHGFTTSAFNDLFHLVRFMGKADRYVDVNEELPILMLRGDSDPCTGYDKGAARSIAVLKKAGFDDIREIKYENMRHEILNEEGHDRIYADVLHFLNG